MSRNFFILTLLLLLPAGVYALRCGNDVVQLGDHQNEVIRKCGAPLSQEEIGYIDTQRKNSRITVMKIEELSYEINGRFYYLRFEGNELVKIQSE